MRVRFWVRFLSTVVPCGFAQPRFARLMRMIVKDTATIIQASAAVIQAAATVIIAIVAGAWAYWQYKI